MFISTGIKRIVASLLSTLVYLLQLLNDPVLNTTIPFLQTAIAGLAGAGIVHAAIAPDHLRTYILATVAAILTFSQYVPLPPEVIAVLQHIGQVLGLVAVGFKLCEKKSP